MKKFTWITEAGRRIYLDKMKDEHLLNAQRMLRRNLVEAMECTAMYCHPIFGPHGEMAQEAAGRAMDEIWERESKIRYVVKLMNKEIVKRGLKEKAVIGPRSLPKIKNVEALPQGGTLVEIDIDKDSTLPLHID